MNPELRLHNAVRKARHSELVKKQQNTIGNTELSCKIEAVKEKQKVRPGKKEGKSCLWCSGTFHDRSKCPTSNNRCFKCGKPGHFKKVCRIRAIKAIKVESTIDPDLPHDNPCS